MGSGVSLECTLPQLLLRNRERWGTRAVALRTKQYGVWRQYSWMECCRRTKTIFLGLRTLGLEAGTRVCILGRSSPEWLFCEIAVEAARGVVSGIHEGLSADDTEALLSEVGVDIALVEGQEQVDKLLGIRARLPRLQRIVHWRAKGVDRYQDPILLSLDELERLGELHESSHPRDLEDSAAKGNGEDVAIQFLTIRQGQVRVVPATHSFLLSFAAAAYADGAQKGRGPLEYVTGVNPCWFFEQALGYAECLLTGQILDFPEAKDTVNRDFREISPQVVARPPQAWDALSSAIRGNLDGSTRLKRAVSRRGLSIGEHVAGISAEAGPTGIVGRSLHRAADLAVLGPLRDKHGLNRARLAYVAGGSAAEETRLLFRSMNVHLRHIYCSTRDGLVTTDPGEEHGLN